VACIAGQKLDGAHDTIRPLNANDLSRAPLTSHRGRGTYFGTTLNTVWAPRGRSVGADCSDDK
jgi:hypothetical protein